MGRSDGISGAQFQPPTQMWVGDWASDFRCGGVKQAVSQQALGTGHQYQQRQPKDPFVLSSL